MDDIQWLSADGQKIGTASAGAAALRESLARYFKGCASCPSSLELKMPGSSAAVH
jgi:hypothetical protein